MNRLTLMYIGLTAALGQVVDRIMRTAIRLLAMKTQPAKGD